MIRKPNLRYFARDNGVEHYVYEKAWVINYDQLEVVIAEYMQTHAYIPAEIRSKRAKERSADTTDTKRKKRKRYSKMVLPLRFFGLP